LVHDDNDEEEDERGAAPPTTHAMPSMGGEGREIGKARKRGFPVLPF